MQHNIVRFNSAWKSCLISNKNGMKTTIVMLHLTSKKLREDWERQHPADVKKRVSGSMECLHPDFLWVFLAHTLQMSALDIENWIKTTYSTISNNRTYYIWLSKKDNLMLLNQLKAFSINLNAQWWVNVTLLHCYKIQFKV